MTRHAMAYVQMSQLVREEMDGHLIGEPLKSREKRLLDAETELVRAYGDWRAGMKVAAQLGSKKAAAYLARTTWDLT